MVSSMLLAYHILWPRNTVTTCPAQVSPNEGDISRLQQHQLLNATHFSHERRPVINMSTQTQNRDMKQIQHKVGDKNTQQQWLSDYSAPSISIIRKRGRGINFCGAVLKWASLLFLCIILPSPETCVDKKHQNTAFQGKKTWKEKMSIVGWQEKE